MLNSSRLIAEYVAGIDSISESLHGLTAAQTRARPIAGTWTPLEVVCHLADSEALFAERMKRVLAEDRPALPYADPNLYVAGLAYEARVAQEEVAVIAALRRQMSRILQAQPEEAWRRVGIHSRDGEQSLEDLVRKAIAHLGHHLQFLRAKRDVLTPGDTAGGSPQVSSS
jgi:hypothetical protein